MDAKIKKAQSLAKKLTADRNRILKSSEKIGKVLLTTETIIGGYKMIQKLRKQKSLFDSLAEVMKDRINIFEENSSSVVETK